MNSVFVANWREGWRWLSNAAFALIVAINAAKIPPELVALLPKDWQAHLTIVLAICGVLGRFINQSKTSPPHFDSTLPQHPHPMSSTAAQDPLQGQGVSSGRNP